jgi:hypothetical protein
LKRTLALLGLAFLYAAIPASAQAAPSTAPSAPPATPGQSAPAPTDPEALAVRVHAVYLAAEQGGAVPSAAPWEAENVKYTTGGSPAPFKLVGPNIAVFIGVTPFVRKDGKGFVLYVEGQVGVLRSDGGFSYQATVSKIDVEYGESVLFLPLGLKSPLRVEIAVFRAADLPGQGGSQEAAAPTQKTGR